MSTAIQVENSGQAKETPNDDRATAELQKLKLEIESLKSKNKWEASIGRFLPIITALVAIGGFWITLHQFTVQQKNRETERETDQAQKEAERNERQRLRDVEDKRRSDEQKQREADRDLALANEIKKSNETREQEFKKPFWQKQIDLYFEASEAVATLANSTNAAEKEKAEQKFWRLFYGPLVMVEDAKVERAMINIRDYLIACKSDPGECRDYKLGRLSLALSSSCKESLGKSWRIKLEQLRGKYSDLSNR